MILQWKMQILLTLEVQPQGLRGVAASEMDERERGYERLRIRVLVAVHAARSRQGLCAEPPRLLGAAGPAQRLHEVLATLDARPVRVGFTRHQLPPLEAEREVELPGE